MKRPGTWTVVTLCVESLGVARSRVRLRDRALESASRHGGHTRFHQDRRCFRVYLLRFAAR